MAKQRPPIELDQLSQTLKDSKGQGMDAFFPSSPPPQADTKPSESPAQFPVTKPVPQPVKMDVDTDVTTSVRQDVNYRAWRDIIENTETRGSSLRMTNDEVFAVEDMIKDLERQMKIKTSLNEAARLGLLYILEDFKKNKEKSLIYKVKKS
jgi:hypothetical protein